MNDREYYADYSRISQSMLKVYRDSPEKFRRQFILDKTHPDYLPPSPSTSAQVIGTLVHHAVLTPEKPLELWMVADCQTRTSQKFLQEAKFAERDGKWAVTENEVQIATAMTRSVRRSEGYRKMVEVCGRQEGWIVEEAFFWNTENLPKKAKLDLLAWPDERAVIVELKTTQTPQYKDFRQSCFRYGYHVQMAWYDEAVRVLTQQEEIRHYVLAVGNVPPYDVGFYPFSPWTLQKGREIFYEAEQKLRFSLDNDLWDLHSIQQEQEI